MATNQDSNKDQTKRPTSGRRRILRGWLTFAVGCIAVAEPLLIGEWGTVFPLVLAPVGVFIIIVGLVEVARGAAQLQRESR